VAGKHRASDPSGVTGMLRSATLSDLDEVASWIATAGDCELWAGWRVPFPIDRARLPEALEFAETNSFCLVSEREVIAFGQIVTKGHRAHLARLIVKPAVRGEGYGTMLVAGVFGWLLARHLRGIPGVSNVRPRKLWVGPQDVHIRFTYRGQECIVWEPYGDNSRWWIGPDDTNSPSISLDELEHALAAS
jgi:GNAT superfamily N-acetyltransferase